MQPLVSPGSGPLPNVPSQQPTNLFRFGEITLFSTHRWENGRILSNGRYRLFATPLGGSGQGYPTLSPAETNLKEGGRIPQGQAYDVYGVAAQVLGTNETTGFQDVAYNNASLVGDLQNVVNNATLSWDFTQTQVDICPLMLAGAGGGLFGSVSQNAAGANVGAMNNGNGGIWMYRKHLVALPGSTTFAILLQFGNYAAPVAGAIPAGEGEDAAALAIRVVLLGFYKSVIEIG